MLYEKYLKVAKQLLSFKSVSTDKAFVNEIEKTLGWLNKYFEKNEFSVEIIRGYGNPVLIAKYNVSDDKETYFVYGHYDVQPAKIEDGWDSDPFTLTERDGKLYARGIVDNKGQFLVHLIAITDLIEKRKLDKNIIFVIEGDEETGGDGISKLFKDHPELFKADQYMISDGEMPYKPVVTASFRGTINLEIEVTTANTNLHSGLYGGAVPSASIEAAKFISKMYDDDYNILIPGFYDKDVTPSEKEMELCKEMDKVKKEAGTLTHTGVRSFTTKRSNGSFCAQVGFTTTLVPSGIVSGYVDNGYSNIEPAKAIIKLNVRLAANQTVDNVLNAIEQFVADNQTKYAEIKIVDKSAYIEPIKIDITSETHVKAMKLLEDVYGHEVLVDYCGATLPVVVDIYDTFGVAPVLISLGNDDCNMHGINENYDIGLIKKGLEFSSRFFSE